MPLTVIPELDLRDCEMTFLEHLLCVTMCQSYPEYFVFSLISMTNEVGKVLLVLETPDVTKM